MVDSAKTFVIEDAQIIYRNFSGAPTPFDQQGGKRTFAVVLDKKTADAMAVDGWNVKCKPAREEGEEEFCFIEVTVNYKQRPPKIVVLTDTSATTLTDDTVAMLDWADIRKLDLVAREYQWAVGANSGIKAYLKSMFVTIDEDPLEKKYNQLLNPQQ